MTLAYVNGALVDEEQASVSVLDHGLVVGDGVFETISLVDGRAFAVSRHLDRLARSAAGLGLPAPDLRELRRAIDAVVGASGLGRGRIRVTVTAGRGPLGSARLGGPPTTVVAIATEPLTAPASALSVVPWTRNEHDALVGLKTISYAANVRALEWAHERGSDEAIFANTSGMLCEGTGSNVFVVRAGRLVTPPLSSGCLAGITRSLVLESFGADEQDVPMEAFTPDGIEEAFLTSSIRGAQPVSTIDGKRLAACPGPVTLQVRADYAALIATTIDP